MLRQSMDTVAKARRRKPEGPLDDLILFHIVSSILNLLAWWLRHLDEVDWETMAVIIERVVLTPVRFAARAAAGVEAYWQEACGRLERPSRL